MQFARENSLDDSHRQQIKSRLLAVRRSLYPINRLCTSATAHARAPAHNASVLIAAGAESIDD